MITNIKNKEGFVVAYCEWRLVGSSGYEVPNANIIWVNDLWVHRDFRMRNLINRIIDEIMFLIPYATGCYFQRLKRNTKLHFFSKLSFGRRRQHYMKVGA